MYSQITKENVIEYLKNVYKIFIAQDISQYLNKEKLSKLKLIIQEYIGDNFSNVIDALDDAGLVDEMHYVQDFNINFVQNFNNVINYIYYEQPKNSACECMIVQMFGIIYTPD